MKITALLTLFITTFTLTLSSQCETWVGSPNEDALTSQHSVYRSFIKSENYADAIGPWKEVYAAAPAADAEPRASSAAACFTA